ncbi:MAG: hypothetical protein BWY67_01027 [Bacteroidetes bacterium ADurb.Bin397]|nr:MAG: hypothetical protein BWY67_01027 [Bacteroidetes bacterium ADurb.Bin397]
MERSVSDAREYCEQHPSLVFMKKYKLVVLALTPEMVVVKVAKLKTLSIGT